MENSKLIEKLKNKANISYEEAKSALENNDWDILDAMLYLEREGKIKDPSVSTFYTNENKDSHYEDDNVPDNNKIIKKNGSKKRNNFEGIFEAICKAIDTCNNIFFEISKGGRMFLKIPITVLILLLLFAFGIVIPLVIVGLFFDIEFSIYSKRVNTDKANKVFKEISLWAKKIKEEIKKGFNHG
ncbi:ubiquitin [Clostridium sp. AL.422]|uniref:ubiquitin n=1 Tax=Clostridium TaxID=1485 RepID=UPI00293DA9A9|nr:MULTISPECIES: ubiquitin [unclassified Clostridium]MDV4149598.1 ubiquitin [Clostridium sp. AL.422]